MKDDVTGAPELTHQDGCALSSIREAYVGIDVSVALKKRVPASVCVREHDRLVPLELRSPKPPLGIGNAATLSEERTTQFAKQTAKFLREVAECRKLEIVRIAIDAPRGYRPENRRLRESEEALRKHEIAFFVTPSRTEFDETQREANAHLQNGGEASRLPSANQLWMLAGFQIWKELTAALKAEFLETHPHAVSVRLKAAKHKKSSAAGFQCRLKAVCRLTGWESTNDLEQRLQKQGYGSRHDKLDAFLSAWVASLPADEREALGRPPYDAIWVPPSTLG